MSCSLSGSNITSRTAFSSCSNWINVSLCVFWSMSDTSNYGGAIYSALSGVSISVSDSFFYYCRASYGGAIYLSASPGTYAARNCFYGCSASTYGQTFYSTCSSSTSPHQLLKCSIALCAPQASYGLDHVTWIDNGCISQHYNNISSCLLSYNQAFRIQRFSSLDVSYLTSSNNKFDESIWFENSNGISGPVQYTNVVNHTQQSSVGFLLVVNYVTINYSYCIFNNNAVTYLFYTYSGITGTAVFSNCGFCSNTFSAPSSQSCLVSLSIPHYHSYLCSANYLGPSITFTLRNGASPNASAAGILSFIIFALLHVA